jgi:hypothetical protein
MDYKYISQNTLEYLSLHDCIIEAARIENGDLILDFEHIDVLSTHPLNPNGEAKYTGKASLMFKNFEVLKSFVYDTSNVHKNVIHVEEDASKVCVDILNLAIDFEVLDLKKIDITETNYSYEFGGNCSSEFNSDFGVFILRFDSVLVCWNDLLEDAWFVGFNKKE